MKLHDPRRACAAGGDRGFAIVLTLLVITMLTVLVIGFNAATRTEQMAARNFSYQESAGQMASVALNRAVALLNTNITNGTVTQPGRSWSVDSREVLLSSASVGSSSASTNINSWQSGVGDMMGRPATNYFISTNTTPAFFTVPLIDVRVGTNLIGRYGFWIDDDASRMNLNAAMATARTNFLPTNSRPFVFSNTTISSNFSGARATVFNSLLNPGASPNRLNGWGYFFTPRQLTLLPNSVGLQPPSDRAITSLIFNSLMWQVGAGPLNRPSRPYVLGLTNGPAFLDVNPTNGILFAYGLSNFAGSYSSLTNALDRLVNSTLSGSNYLRYFGTASGLAGKYTTNIARQIVANINDNLLNSPTNVATWDTNRFTGATTNDMFVGTSFPVPRAVFGQRPTPYLNEIGVAVAVYTNPSGNEAEIQIWLRPELVDPYRTGRGTNWAIFPQLKSLRFSGTAVRGTNQLTFSNPGTSYPNWGFTSSIPPLIIPAGFSGTFYVPPNAYAFEWQVRGTAGASIDLTGASNIVVTNVQVQPDWVVLRSSPSTAAAAVVTVRDWAAGAETNSPRGDWPVLTFSSSGIQNNTARVNTFGPRTPGSIDFSRGRGIAKNDPRVRTFPDYEAPARAWYPTGGTNPAPTLGANNTGIVNYSGGTGRPGVGNDRAGAANPNDIHTHPSFYIATNIPPVWLSAFDLSRIHTGLQWRTLQLRAQDSSEATAGFVPDWAVLEAFAVSNNPAPVQVKLNVNSIPYPALTAAGSAANLLAQGLTRAPVVSALLAGNTNPTSATNASFTVGGSNYNLGLPAGAAFPASGAGSFNAVATNLATLIFTNSWGNRRSTNTNVFPPNAYSLVSEVLEIDNVSNFSTDEAANEGRARGFYDALTVSSDVFTVYAVGYAMDKQTNVVAETRMRAQVARDPAATNRFRIIFAEPLVWP